MQSAALLKLLFVKYTAMVNQHKINYDIIHNYNCNRK